MLGRLTRQREAIDVTWDDVEGRRGKGRASYSEICWSVRLKFEGAGGCPPHPLQGVDPNRRVDPPRKGRRWRDLCQDIEASLLSELGCEASKKTVGRRGG